MICRDTASLKRIQMDHRFKHERMSGLTIIDLNHCEVFWTKEKEMTDNMFASSRNML